MLSENVNERSNSYYILAKEGSVFRGNIAWMQIKQLLFICETNQRKAMQTGCSSSHWPSLFGQVFFSWL